MFSESLNNERSVNEIIFPETDLIGTAGRGGPWRPPCFHYLANSVREGLSALPSSCRPAHRSSPKMKNGFLNCSEISKQLNFNDIGHEMVADSIREKK